MKQLRTSLTGDVICLHDLFTEGWTIKFFTLWNQGSALTVLTWCRTCSQQNGISVSHLSSPQTRSVPPGSGPRCSSGRFRGVCCRAAGRGLGLLPPPNSDVTLQTEPSSRAPAEPTQTSIPATPSTCWTLLAASGARWSRSTSWAEVMSPVVQKEVAKEKK